MISRESLFICDLLRVRYYVNISCLKWPSLVCFWELFFNNKTFVKYLWKNLRGRCDAAFRLGEETRQILFGTVKQTRWATRSKFHSLLKILKVWLSITEGFPTARSRVTIKKLSNTWQKILRGWYDALFRLGQLVCFKLQFLQYILL